MLTPSLLLEAVRDVARATGEVALRHFRRDLKVEWKADGSEVTVADREAEGREVDARAHAGGAAGGFDAPARQSAQVVMPRIVQMLQTKRPHPSQGYPSDARSSRPHERHVMASRSCRCVMLPSRRVRAPRGDVRPARTPGSS